MKNNNRPIVTVFLICFLYWGYLILNSHMLIICDAIDYGQKGIMLAEKGWQEYFITGPNREPFYPWLVSLSMRIGAFFSISYQSIQVVLQFFLLFISQLLVLRVLRLLKINDWLSALAILYLGVSPALVNSALSLYSEIAIYPLVLCLILLMLRAWGSFSREKNHIFLPAVAMGLTFVLMTLTKGIFEVIAPVSVAIFFLSTLFTRNRKFILNAFMYSIVVFAVFFLLVTGYKLANKIYNGRFVITNRGAVMLYGSAARRTEPLTGERFLTALAYIPGEGVCRSIFGEEKCSFWAFEKSDSFGYDKVHELAKGGLSSEETDKETIRLAVEKILRKPGQFILLWLMEGCKIFFWESTQMGFVIYPPGLARIFGWGPLKNGLRLGMALLTIISFAFALRYLIRERKKLFVPQGCDEIIVFFIILFIFLFTGASAICLILPRYILPMVPLFLVICVFTADKIISSPRSG